MSAWTSSGSRRSEMDVKPETSAKSTLTCLRSPESAARSFRIRAARCAGVYARGDSNRGDATARAAEFLSRRDAGAARGTHHVERRAALLAEPHARAVLGSTRGAPHPGYSTRADGVTPAPSGDGPCGPLVAVWGSERGRVGAPY